MGSQQSIESSIQATEDHRKSGSCLAPPKESHGLSSVDRTGDLHLPKNTGISKPVKSDDRVQKQENTKKNVPVTSSPEPDDNTPKKVVFSAKAQPNVVTELPVKEHPPVQDQEKSQDNTTKAAMGPRDMSTREHHLPSILTRENSKANEEEVNERNSALDKVTRKTAQNASASTHIKGNTEHAQNLPENRSADSIGDSCAVSMNREAKTVVEQNQQHKDRGDHTDPAPAPPPSPMEEKPETAPIARPSDTPHIQFGPNFEENEHESNRKFRYRRNLYEKDLAFSNEGERKLFWVLGRFLTNTRIGSTIIRKYQERGLGVDAGQSMMTFFMTSALSALPSYARHFLLEDNHRNFESPWMPYLQFARQGTLSEYIRNSRLYASMFTRLVAFQVEKSKVANESESTENDKADNAKPTVVGNTIKLEAPEKQKLELNLPDQTFGEKTTTVPMDFLVGKFYSYDDSDLQFQYVNSTKPMDGDRNNNRAYLWNASPSTKGDANATFKVSCLFSRDTISAANATSKPNQKKIHDKSGKNPGLWPWSNDCEHLVQKVICLVHCNSRFKSDQINNSGDNFDTNKKSRNRGKRRSKGSSEPTSEKNTSPSKDTSTEKEESEWRYLSDTFTTSDVLFSGRGLVIFPFVENKSNSLIFFNGSGEKAANEIYRIGNMCLCGCQLKRKTITPNDPHAFCTISKDEWHHHDTLQINLLMPTSPSTRFDLAVDTPTILNVFSQYLFSLREHAFQNRDMSVRKKVYEKHFQEYQRMCENMINFIIFSEECGPAELKLKASEYLTNARMHHEAAKDSAIEIGVFPTYIETLNSLVITLPEELKIVEKPSSYNVAFEFCDFRLPDQNLQTKIKMQNIVEPTCVGILESILGKNYLNHVDDELIYKAVTNQYNLKGQGDCVAMVTPIHKKLSNSKIRLYEAIKPSFSADSLTDESRQWLDEKVLKICRNAYNTFVAATIENDRNSHSFDSRMDPIWKHIHRFCNDMQDSCAKAFSMESVSGDNGSQELCDDAGTEKPESTDTATPVSEESSKNSENSPTSETKSQLSDSGKSPNEGDAGKPQDKRKHSKEYMSPAKRQQRQVQRLREKWEKKHKASTSAQKS